MDFSLLRNRNYVLLWMGGLVSNLGTALMHFALSLYVMKTTGSAALFASVLVVGAIPRLILGPIGGVFADWIDRKKLIVGLDAISGIVTLAFAGLYMAKGSLSVWEIYALVIVLQTVNAFFDPAVGAVLPSIVEKERLMSANAFRSSSNQMLMLFAPIIAGVIYGFAGIFMVLVIDGISFLFSSISEAFIQMPKGNLSKTKPSLAGFVADFKDGLSFMINNRFMIAIIAMALVVNMTFGPMFSVVMPFALVQRFGVSPEQLGFFNFLLGFGMVFGPMLAALVSKKIKPKHLISLGLLATSAFVAIMGYFMGIIESDGITGAIQIIAITGGIMSFAAVFVGMVNVCVSTIFQKTVPLEKMGRVGSVLGTLMMASQPIGSMVAGGLTEVLRTDVVVYVVAISGVLGVAVYAWLMRGVDIDAPAAEASEQVG